MPIKVPIKVRVACGRRISMCGYTSVPEDGRTYYYHHHHHHHTDDALLKPVAQCLVHTYLTN